MRKARNFQTSLSYQWFELDHAKELQALAAVGKILNHFMPGYGAAGEQTRETSTAKLPAILLFGVGTGRPLNVVSSPERVAGNVVEEIVKEAFK